MRRALPDPEGDVRTPPRAHPAYWFLPPVGNRHGRGFGRPDAPPIHFVNNRPYQGRGGPPDQDVEDDWIARNIENTEGPCKV